MSKLAHQDNSEVDVGVKVSPIFDAALLSSSKVKVGVDTTITAKSEDDIDDDFVEKDSTSFEEQCGFVLHILVVILSIYYIKYIFSFYSSPLLISLMMKHDPMKNTTSALPVLSLQSQPPLWTIILPIATIVPFFVIPIVYGCCINRSATIANTTLYQTLSIIQDPQSIRPLYPSPLFHLLEQRNESVTSSSPASDDSLLYSLYETKYYCDPMSWKPTTVRIATTTNSTSTTTSQNDGATTTGVPDICDIDVADINDLLYLKYK